VHGVEDGDVRAILRPSGAVIAPTVMTSSKS
jgi:hypothetical protein